MSTPKPLHYDLRIGVTGHRNLDDSDKVTDAVERLLMHVSKTFEEASEKPHGKCGSPKSWWEHAIFCCAVISWPLFWLLRMPIPLALGRTPKQQRTPLQWTVISPLAKGADRIVASAVLNKFSGRLKVISPLLLDEYRRDFSDGADRDEFEQLLKCDPRPMELPDPQSEDSGEDEHALRNKAYMNVGRRVVDSCELLIAIWDGQQATGHGGTGDVVRYALGQGRKVLWINAKNPAEKVQLLVPKSPKSDEKPEATIDPLANIDTLPLPKRAKSLSLGFHRLAAYNRDVGIKDDAWQQAIAKHAADLNDASGAAGLTEAEVKPLIENLVPHYVRANQLAVVYQDLYVFAAKWLFRLSAIAVTVVVAQVLFFPHALWLIWFEIAAMACAVVLLWISTNEAWHEKWLNDRRLAEWLRSSQYTLLLGNEYRATEGGHAEKLPFYGGSDNWFVDAFQSMLDQVRASNTPPPQFEQLKRYIIDDWIAGQAAWHKKNAKSKGASGHRIHRIGLALFITTLVMAGLHLRGIGHDDIHETEHTSVASAPHDQAHSEDSPAMSQSWTTAIPWGKLITFLAIILPAWGASVHAVANLLEYHRISARSERMHEVLHDLASHAEEATTYEALCKYVAKTEQIMAAEHDEWLASLSFRGLFLPA